MKEQKNNNDTPKRGEVWFVDFPLEENPNKTTHRPVIVLEENDNRVGVLSVKVTKHEPRKNDKWDYRIFYWKESHLRMQSTARISKTIYLNLNMFDKKLGDLHPDDFEKVNNLFNEYLKELQNNNT